MADLTNAQAHRYIEALQIAQSHLGAALVELVLLRDIGETCEAPRTLLAAVTGSWETLDSRLEELYSALHGNHAKVDDSAAGTDPEAGLGTTQLQ